MRSSGGIKARTIDRLSTQQNIFVQEYCVTFNATQSAIKAGYSERCASGQGARLLSNPNVQAHIAKSLKRLREQTGITKQRIVDEHAKIAFFDPLDVYEYDGQSLKFKILSDISAKHRAAIKSIKTVTNERGDQFSEVKFYDKTVSLDSLAKMLGYVNDRQEGAVSHDFLMSVSKLIEAGTEKELAIEQLKGRQVT